MNIRSWMLVDDHERDLLTILRLMKFNFTDFAFTTQPTYQMYEAKARWL